MKQKHAILIIVFVVVFMASLHYALADVDTFKASNGGIFIYVHNDIIKKDVTDMKYALLYSYSNPDHTAYIIIDSPGGDAIAGFMIYDLLKNHSHPVYTFVKESGIAASAAAVIFMGGRQRYMNKNSRIMFHYAYKEIDGKIIRHDDSPITRYCDSKMKQVLKDNSKLSKSMIHTVLSLELVFNMKDTIKLGIAKEFK